MPGSAHVVLWAMLSALVPAQAEQISSTVTVQTGDDPCAGLTDEECCGQRLEYAGFRALGEHLPRKISATVKLACKLPRITRHVCRSIATTRGFPAKKVDAMCKPAHSRRACRKDGTCRQCAKRLRQLDYEHSHHACYAVTYAPKGGRRVVVLRKGEGVEVTQRAVVPSE